MQGFHWTFYPHIWYIYFKFSTYPLFIVHVIGHYSQTPFNYDYCHENYSMESLSQPHFYNRQNSSYGHQGLYLTMVWRCYWITCNPPYRLVQPPIMNCLRPCNSNWYLVFFRIMVYLWSISPKFCMFSRWKIIF